MRQKYEAALIVAQVHAHLFSTYVVHVPKTASLTPA